MTIVRNDVLRDAARRSFRQLLDVPCMQILVTLVTSSYLVRHLLTVSLRGDSYDDTKRSS